MGVCNIVKGKSHFEKQGNSPGWIVSKQLRLIKHCWNHFIFRISSFIITNG